MAWFLVKSDPDEYSLDDLAKDGSTIWDGVHSFAAIGHIKAMKPGDYVLVYHSQSERSITGIAEVCDHPFLNTDDPRFSWAVELKFVSRLAKPISLAEIKAEPALQDFLLVKQTRLSVMPVPPQILSWFREQSPEVQQRT